ncbi:uncharacterized protein LOC100274189 [Zea mays]|uniref:Uncharacterized protein n=1 Tax=Zea mays TaxID=4577 RepID=B6T898_MAIZE|nr:uncharacterized protein LOC100274189 [Zea mays]ACG33331.1 hypothetical protein [Zea mays]AQK98615.1 hypothetical protein ZEAMMB73_Zm00001d012031 [Zea mays]|eukprot:NP_001307042.1 uncharacterized protein LOC100274189 [Zea mays]
MGACASVHKDPGYPKEQFLDSPTKAEAANEKGGCGGGDDDFADFKSKVDAEQQRAELNPKSPDSGSKDEVFFESRAWLDSDCEDDFYSVNGDFTPSRGSTPIHQPRAQTVMSNIFQPDTHGSKSPEPSPTGRRKLAELLQEAMQNGPEESTDQELQLRSVAADGKPVSESTSSSACSTVTTPIAVANAKSRKEKAWYTGRCCLPSFVHSLTLDESERAQKMSSRPCAV